MLSPHAVAVHRGDPPPRHTKADTGLGDLACLAADSASDLEGEASETTVGLLILRLPHHVSRC